MEEIRVIFQELAEWASKSESAVRVLSVPPKAFQFDLSGEKPFYMTIGDGKLKVGDGSHIKPVLKIVGESGAVERVFRGQVDITHPLANGQLTLAAGDFSEVIDLGRIITSLIMKRKREKK